VGKRGLVIGVDMTPEMIAKSRSNAEKAGLENIDFRLGELENLPVADGIINVIISNCVINLSPEKERVFSEAFRVLKPGGRLAVSDIVALDELPDEMKKDMAYHSACIAGASLIQELEFILQKTGFTNIHIKPKPESKEFIRNWMPGNRIEEYVVSATIEAIKPRA
jgi:ubiquinone/menaquinone biosynthesis C-methylase UbiE